METQIVVKMFHVKHRLSTYDKLVDFLLERNLSVNLTAIRNREDVFVKHVEDSLIASDLVASLLPNAKKGLDLGTGAGFPGLIIAKEHPDIDMTLLDSVEKKMKFVREAIVLLGLQNTHAITDRAESLAMKQSGAFDFIIARSVAHLEALLEYASPLLSVSGMLLAMKMQKPEDELQQGKKVCATYGFTFNSAHPYALLDQQRTIHCFQKTMEPKIKLPRQIGAAVHKPFKGRTS